MAYSFTATVASRGYHVYKNTSWTNAKVGEKVTVEMETKKSSLEVDPFACAIKTVVYTITRLRNPATTYVHV